MATTLADFKGWQIIVKDEHGGLINDSTKRRRRRRGGFGNKEYICLQRKSDGLILSCGDSIVCRDPQTNSLAVYMIHEIRLNTASNYVELWCFGYLCWYEINPKEYYAQFLPEVLDSCPEFESEIEVADYFREKFQLECNKSELYLTAELSELYLKDFVSLAKIYDSDSFSSDLITEDNQTHTFVVSSACEPDGNTFVHIDIRAIEEYIRESDPERSKKYLKELTADVKLAKSKKKKIDKPRKETVTSKPNFIKEEKSDCMAINTEDPPIGTTSSPNSKSESLEALPTRGDNRIGRKQASSIKIEDDKGILADVKNAQRGANRGPSRSTSKAKRVTWDTENIKNHDETSQLPVQEDDEDHYNATEIVDYQLSNSEDDLLDNENYETDNDEEDVRPSRKITAKPDRKRRRASSSPTKEPSTPKRAVTKKNVVRAKKAYTPFSKLYKRPQDIPDLTKNKDFYRDTHEWDISALENQFRSPSKQRTVETIFSKVKRQLNSNHGKEEIVKASNFNDYLPARENEFATIYLSAYSAIEAGTGTSIYIAGTPGVGKTLTVREVVKELLISADRKELPKFQYIEINGLKMVKPTDSYDFLWKKLSGSTLTSGAAMESLEYYFKEVPLTKKRPVVILLDELDALVTKNQDVMYNFFNWTTYENSKLIVVAVANTMDLPERQLGNKVSSRIGFTRIMFTGYTHDELKTIINLRLEGLNDSHFFVDPSTGSSYLYQDDELSHIPEDISKLQKVRLKISDDAIEIASRKIASVSGDARRALKVCKRAVEIAEHDYMVRHGYQYAPTATAGKKIAVKDNEKHEELQRVEIKHITKALHETINSPTDIYMNRLSFTCKLFLYALVNLIKKSGSQEQTLGDIIDEIRLLIEVNGRNKYILELKRVFFFADGVAGDEEEQLRIISWDYLINQLVETGLVIKQNLKNERMCAVKLNLSFEEVSKNIMDDEVLKTL
ncbi:HGL265Cp [Eremothecium sinecaudum]|uniref:Origin recognition complex subunit 1 n=1 Tax=Eremothecium sinecaudum TaxID=45286 RepID=A0A0X8HV59_9SACH|nr:HGL265Cp [Eremothecium sinecaudum]AMD22075.1 HGL265Cp [Eremothecium sinecaudum]